LYENINYLTINNNKRLNYSYITKVLYDANMAVGNGYVSHSCLFYVGPTLRTE